MNIYQIPMWIGDRLITPADIVKLLLNPEKCRWTIEGFEGVSEFAIDDRLWNSDVDNPVEMDGPEFVEFMSTLDQMTNGIVYSLDSFPVSGRFEGGSTSVGVRSERVRLEAFDSTTWDFVVPDEKDWHSHFRESLIDLLKSTI